MCRRFAAYFIFFAKFLGLTPQAIYMPPLRGSYRNNFRRLSLELSSASEGSSGRPELHRTVGVDYDRQLRLDILGACGDRQVGGAGQDEGDYGPSANG